MESRIVSRRNALRLGGASAAAALAGCMGGDDDEDNNTEGATTDDTGDSDAFTIGVLQDITGANGPEFAHQGLAGLLSGFAYKNDDTPMPLEENAVGRIDWTDGENYGTDPAVIMEELNGETLRYTVDNSGGVDVDLEFLIRDTASDAETATNIATDLIEQCDLLYGTSSSDEIVRVNNIILSQTDIPMFVGQGTTSDLTADETQCRDQLFRATENIAMTSRAGAINIVEDPEITQVAMFGAQSSLGRDVLNNYRQIFDNETGIEYTEEYIPIGLVTNRWKDKLDRADEQGVDAAVYGFTGQTATFFAEAFVQGDYDMKAFGQAPSRLTFREVGISALDSVEEEFGIRELSEFVVDQLPFGPIACRYFWNQYDNEINDWLINEHIDTYGVLPDMFTSSAFASASAIVQAFEQAGEASADAILEEVSGMTVEATPKGQGEYVFQEYNNQARSPITIAEFQPREAEKWPAALQPSEPINFIDKDLTTIPQDDPRMTCDLS